MAKRKPTKPDQKSASKPDSETVSKPDPKSAPKPNPKSASKPAPKSASKPARETRTSFTYPSLHEAVSEAVSAEIAPPRFEEDGGRGTSNNSFSSNVMGKFTCTNRKCSNARWSSKKVAIVIRGYPGNRYDALVYNQRCRGCDGLGTFALNKDSYVERVAYRLKRWAGIQMEPPPYTKKTTPPHRNDLCEGCKQGVCMEGNGRGSFDI